MTSLVSDISSQRAALQKRFKTGDLVVIGDSWPLRKNEFAVVLGSNVNKNPYQLEFLVWSSKSQSIQTLTEDNMRKLGWEL